MKKIMFACLLAVPLTSIAVLADTTDVIQERNNQLADLVKDSFYSDVHRLNLTPDQYTAVVKNIRHSNDTLASDIKKILNKDQQETFEIIISEKKSAIGDSVIF